MKEIWKDIQGFSKYQVSNHGKVRNIRTGKVRKTSNRKQRYILVTLITDENYKSRKTMYLHRLVAMAFVDGYKPGLHVDHIDFNKHNNLYTNLRWLTQSENFEDAHKNGRHAGYSKGCQTQ